MLTGEYRVDSEADGAFLAIVMTSAETVGE